MALSIRKRWELVFLCRHPRGPKLGFKLAAKEVGCSTTTAKKWVKRFEDTEDVQDEVGRGRKRKTTANQDQKIVDIVQKKRTIHSGEIAMELKSKGVDLSARTVRRRLNEAGYQHLSPLLKPLLTEKAIQTRLNWAQDNRSREWFNVIFTDETTFESYRSPTKIWRTKAEHVVYPKVKHPLKLHVWGLCDSVWIWRDLLFHRKPECRSAVQNLRGGPTANSIKHV